MSYLVLFLLAADQLRPYHRARRLIAAMAASSPPTSSSAAYTVSSGYWSGAAGMSLYLPVILKR